MNDKQVCILKKVEFSAFGTINKSKVETYLKLNNVYIKSTINRNSSLLKNSEIQLFPNVNYKLWVFWFLKKLRIKKYNITFTKLVGLYLSWPFIQKIQFPLSADVIFYRLQSAVMLYDKPNNMQVIKTGLSDWGSVKLNQEKLAIHVASKINHHKVKIPKILFERNNEKINYFVQDFFGGKQISYNDDLSCIFNNVFDFLKTIYISNGIELKSLNENSFLNHAFVEEYIGHQKGGKKIVEAYKILLNNDKKMLWGWVHGDLSHNNILFNESSIWIIDWGKSKYNYLATDLDISNFKTDLIFNQLIVEAKINKESLYSLNEQIFLKRYAEINRLVHNGIKRNTLSPSFNKVIKTQIQILLSIELNK